MTRFAELLQATLSGIKALSEDQLTALETHYQLLVKWNARMNLTAIRSMEEAVVRHYAESIFLGTLMPPSGRVADVGSGAGFPGIPLGIVWPEASLDLIESHQRKAVFLREATRDLSNFRILAKRAEDISDKYDWVISRALVWQDVVRVKASRYALLVGGDDIPSMPTDRHDARLPWGENRWAVMFHVERSF